MKKRIFVFIISIATILSVNTANYKVHRLKEGETLWRISKIYGINLDALCKFNKINDVTKVKQGSEIKIPQDSSETKKNVTNNNPQKKDSNKTDKKFMDFTLPLKGDVKPFITSHFRGIIIFSDAASSVLSMSEGEISFAENVNGYGKTIIIKNKEGFIFTYSGFTNLYVKKGEKIDKNTVIGLSGQLSRYSRKGALVSIQYKDKYLKFDMEKMRFYI